MIDCAWKQKNSGVCLRDFGDGIFDEHACSPNNNIDETNIEDAQEGKKEIWLNVEFMNGALSYIHTGTKERRYLQYIHTSY